MNKDEDNLPGLNIGDLVVILYDCWLHSFDGAEYIEEGEVAVVIEKRNKLLYKPVRIFTTKGLDGWVYSSNINLLTEQY